MQEELKKPEYSKIKLVKIAYGNDDDQKSFTETQGLLQAYPNLKAIVAPTTVGIAAAARYISTSSSKGKVAVTGLGTPNQMRAFVKNGTVKAFQLWDPGQLGYPPRMPRQRCRRARSPARKASRSTPASSASAPSGRKAKSFLDRRPRSIPAISITSISRAVMHRRVTLRG